MAPEALVSDVATPTIDLEKLLAPISVDRPAGEWLRDDQVYRDIEEARKNEDASLSRGVWERQLEQADWNRVATLCLEALETRTKDAQLAAWLTEAAMHLSGFSGTASGLEVLTALYDSFWDDLHPPLEDGDPEFRLMPVHWINEKLYLELKMIPLTRPGAGQAPVYRWADWESAQYLAHVAAKDKSAFEKAEAQGKPTSEKFLASVTVTDSAVFQGIAVELERCLTGVDTLTAVLDRRAGAAAPSLARFRETLDSIDHFVAQVLAERGDASEGQDGGPPKDEGAREVDAAVEAEAGEGALFSGGGPIRSRAEAYRRLSEAADYLLRTEPHSPTPYLVKRAVAWGGLSLSELLGELMSQHGNLDSLYKLLGMKPPGGG